MFMVILYHSEVYFGSGHSWSWIFQPVFLTGFFFISGYFFTNDISNVNLSDKFKQTVRSVIVPYLVFMSAFLLQKCLAGSTDVVQGIVDLIVFRASWFVIAIGGLQLSYALALKICPTLKSLMISTFIMFLAGYAMVLMYRDCPDWILDNPWLNSKELPSRLPFCLNIFCVQSPFFMLGILYRKYEFFLEKYIVRGVAIGSLLYVMFYMWIDHGYIGSSMCVVIDEYNNILLMYSYAVIGIFTMVGISKYIQCIKPVNYIGKCSILFYFMNGMALTFVSRIIAHIPNIDNSCYWGQIAVAFIATGLMFPLAWFIGRYMPLLKGDKVSFNRLSKKIGLDVKW